MESNFSEREWNGEFFIPGDYENRFIGTITFSPEKGVVLSYLIATQHFSRESEVLYGVLATGEQCTLIGTFNPTHSDFNFKNGLTTYNGRTWFYFLVIGKFLDENELFSEVSFSLTGMQKFFFPNGYKDLIKYSIEPLLTVSTDYGQIEVGNNANFSILREDITAQIYNRNDEALIDLKRAFAEINTKYENSLFMLKKEISYMLTIKTNVECNIGKLYEYITDISNLFAILIYSPVYPEVIKLKHIDNPYSSIVYPSMALEKRTADLCKRKYSHFRMPITKNKINLENVIENWIKQSKKFTMIISSLQHETGFRNEHSVHGELVLYATQFESISHQAGVGNAKKYEYPVNQFGTDKIKNLLTQIFSNVGETDFAKGIGSLRNEIAHVGRPKDLLSTLTIRDMVNISQLLQITILGYALNTIGVDSNMISEYQNKLI